MNDYQQNHRGNPFLRKADSPYQYTQYEIEEIIKCKQDYEYFVRNYVKIVTLDRGIINFEPYDFQLEMLKSFVDNRNTIVCTSRQIGKTTTFCAFVLHYIIFHPNKIVAVAANKGDMSKDILSRIEFSYQNLPKFLQHGIMEWQKTSFKLDNGSRVISTTTSDDSLRGFPINVLIIDEAARIEHWDEFAMSTMPTISSGKTTKIILVSTPKGLNYFFDIWTNAKKGRNGYHPIEVPWQMVPGRDEEWRKKALADCNFDEQKFAQEYEVEFMGSSGTLIAGWKLKQLVRRRGPYAVKTKRRPYFL